MKKGKEYTSLFSRSSEQNSSPKSDVTMSIKYVHFISVIQLCLTTELIDHAIKVETKSRFHARTDSWGNVEPKGERGHSKLLNTEATTLCHFSPCEGLNMLVISIYASNDLIFLFFFFEFYGFRRELLANCRLGTRSVENAWICHQLFHSFTFAISIYVALFINVNSLNITN